MIGKSIMGLVRNLKKTLNDWVNTILVELSSAYIKHLAKQTLKKQGNSLSMESSPNPLTQENRHTTIVPSSADTSEKIIMEKTIEPLVQIRDWSIDRIHHLAEYGSLDQQFDAVAIAEEFDEWINIPEDVKELDYLCLEDQDIGDKEMDIN